MVKKAAFRPLPRFRPRNRRRLGTDYEDENDDEDPPSLVATARQARTMEPSSVSLGARMERSIGDSEASEQLFGVRLDLRCGFLGRQNFREAALAPLQGGA